MTAALLGAGLAAAQAPAGTGYAVGAESRISLAGNSTMHEYSATASGIGGKVSADTGFFGRAGNGPAHLFREVRISIPVRNLKSGNEKLDDKMYDALGADDHPAIEFSFAVHAAANNRVQRIGTSRWRFMISLLFIVR